MEMRQTRTIMRIVLTITVIAIALGYGETQAQETGEAESQELIFEVPARQLPAKYVIEPRSQILKDLGFKLLFEFDEAQPDGTINAMRFNATDANGEKLGLETNKLGNIVRNEVKRESYIFRIQYNWKLAEQTENQERSIKQKAWCAMVTINLLSEGKITLADIKALDPDLQEVIVDQLDSNLSTIKIEEISPKVNSPSEPEKTPRRIPRLNANA